MSTSIVLLSLFPPPSSKLSRTHFSFTHKPTFLLSSNKVSFHTLKASTAANGAGVSVPAATVEEPKVQEASEGPAESSVPVEAQEDVSKFEEPRWVNGTWDLKQFQKNGQTDWDAVIDAEARRRKWLENNPESSSNDDPVVFDTSIIPWWAWMKRYHLPEAELLNVFGVLLIRKNEDIETLKKLLEETTFYDKQWQATWQDETTSDAKKD